MYVSEYLTFVDPNGDILNTIPTHAIKIPPVKDQVIYIYCKKYIVDNIEPHHTSSGSSYRIEHFVQLKNY